VVETRGIGLEYFPYNAIILEFNNNSFKVLDANTKTWQSENLLREDFVGKQIEDLFENLRETDLYKNFLSVYQTGKEKEFYLPFYTKNKLTKYHQGTIQRLEDKTLLLAYKNIDNSQDIILQESLEKFKKISNNSLFGIFMYKEHYTYANEAFMKMTGYSFKELQSMQPWELANPSSHEHLKKNIQRRLSGEVFSSTYNKVKLRAKDGRDLCIKLAVETIYSDGEYAGLGTVVDISDVIEKENKLRLLAQALEQTDNMLMISDKEGNITYLNDILASTFGYKKEELIGAKTSIFKSGQHSRDFYEDLWDTILSGKNYNNKLLNKTKDGKLIDVELSITPIYTGEKIEHFVATSKDISEETYTQKRLQELATKDSLTKISNRYAIGKYIYEQISAYSRNHQPFALIMFDIDNFKIFNDTYGHYVGDLVLIEVCRDISANLRPLDRFGRWGGEEFMIMLPNTKEQEALSTAQKIRKLVENLSINGHYKVTISAGVCVYNGNETRLQILDRVDKALYEAKESGRNKVVLKKSL
jgi:diguanylate cyclase (GGDEF)-like protein/PAS domain S-box-containing protein